MLCFSVDLFKASNLRPDVHSACEWVWCCTRSHPVSCFVATKFKRGLHSLKQEDLKQHHLTLTEAADLAQNRPLWMMMSTYGATQSELHARHDDALTWRTVQSTDWTQQVEYLQSEWVNYKSVQHHRIDEETALSYKDQRLLDKQALACRIESGRHVTAEGLTIWMHCGLWGFTIPAIIAI